MARFVRARVAHARIGAIDLAAARATKGVVAVFAMADLAAVLPGSPAPLDTLTNADGTAAPAPPRPALATGRVRFAGEAVVLVVAESSAAALDGAEAVAIDYDPLPATAAPSAPPGAAIHDEAEGHGAFDWPGGDAAAVEQAFARAARIVRLRVAVPRILGLPLEPAGAVASYSAAGERWTLVVPSQGAHAIQRELAAGYLAVEPGRLRVITPDVGGAFGLRIHALPEHAALLGAARLLGRTIAWQSDRLESNLCEPHARDLVIDAALALDAEGGFLGLRAEALCAMGAYVHPGARGTPTASLLFGLQGAYRMPAISVRVRGVYTNTTPTGPFRGAGQPEGTYVLERLIDQAAHETGRTPLALRRHNVLQPEDFPYRCASGHRVGSGNPAATLHQAAAWLERRRPAPGGLRGAGLALYLKVNGMGRQERAEVAVTAGSDLVAVRIGSQSNGQGHATTFGALAAARLGLDPAQIRVVQGDTDTVAFGTGTGASSALATTGAGVGRSCVDLLRVARTAAAESLGVAEAALTYEGGVFGVPGGNRFVTLQQLAAEACGTLVGRSEIGVGLTYSFGCHACVVAVDPATGAVRLVEYAAFDDIGPLLQPAIALGQIHGGVAQGGGQALLESMQYDDAAQPVTASLLDYAIPRAADLPGLTEAPACTPDPDNDLGVRGAGEAGAVASMAAVVNAVASCLNGRAAIEAPLTPERVWMALQRAGLASSP